MSLRAYQGWTHRNLKRLKTSSLLAPSLFHDPIPLRSSSEMVILLQPPHLIFLIKAHYVLSREDHWLAIPQGNTAVLSSQFTSADNMHCLHFWHRHPSNLVTDQGSYFENWKRSCVTLHPEHVFSANPNSWSELYYNNIMSITHRQPSFSSHIPHYSDEHESVSQTAIRNAAKW